MLIVEVYVIKDDVTPCSDNILLITNVANTFYFSFKINNEY